MAFVGIDPEEADERSETLTSIKQSIADQKETLIRIQEHRDTYWKGEAADAWHDQVETEHLPKLDTLAESVDEALTDLRGAVERIRQRDAELKDRM